MNKKNIEKSLNRAISEAALLKFNELAETSYIKMEEHDYITRQQRAKVSSAYNYKKLSLIVSLCLIAVVLFTGWMYQMKTPQAIITLDINPSIKIITNKLNKVLKVEALNKDGEAIINNLDLKDKELNVMIDKLLETLHSSGYLISKDSAILVSIENRTKKSNEILSEELDKIIKDSLYKQKISSYVLIQKVSNTEDTNTLAKEYQISKGKMQLIEALISLDNTLTIAHLASLNTEELLTTVNEHNINIDKIVDGYHYYDNENKEDIEEDDESQLNKEDSEDNADGNDDTNEDHDSDNDKNIENNQEDEGNYSRYNKENENKHYENDSKENNENKKDKYLENSKSNYNTVKRSHDSINNENHDKEDYQSKTRNYDSKGNYSSKDQNNEPDYSNENEKSNDNEQINEGEQTNVDEQSKEDEQINDGQPTNDSNLSNGEEQTNWDNQFNKNYQSSEEDYSGVDEPHIEEH